MIRDIAARIEALEKSAFAGQPIYHVKFINGSQATMSLLSVVLYCVDRADILHDDGTMDFYIGNDRVLSLSHQLGACDLKADVLDVIRDYTAHSKYLLSAGTTFIQPYPGGKAFQ